MGIKSSTDRKPESKSGNSQVPSRSVADRLQVFMKGGGCEESYNELIGSCVEEGSVMCREASRRLEKCMKARYDYFQPYLAITKECKEQMLREMQGFLHAKPNNISELFVKFMMTRGGCKEAFMAYQDSLEEAKKNKESLATPAWYNLCNCMQAHPDHYQPMLTVINNFGEQYFKKLKAVLDAREQAEAEAKG